MNRWLKKHWRVLALISAGAVLGATAEHTMGHRVAAAVVRALGAIPPTPGEATPPVTPEPPTGLNHPGPHLKGERARIQAGRAEKLALAGWRNLGQILALSRNGGYRAVSPERPHDGLELIAPGRIAWLGRLGTETRGVPAVSRAYIAEGKRRRSRGAVI